MQTESRLIAFQNQNQQLKMELTEIRNAFELNLGILNILSEKVQHPIKHFYIMLKKLNEQIIDMVGSQIKARNERLHQIQQFHQLQAKHSKANEQIQRLQRQYEKLILLSKEPNKNVNMTRDHFIITPKQSHLILTQSIKDMNSQILALRDSIAKLKSENHYLRYQNRQLRQKLNIDGNFTIQKPFSKLDIPENEILKDQSDIQSPPYFDPELTLVDGTGRKATKNKKIYYKSLEVQIQKYKQQIDSLKRLTSEMDSKFNIVLGAFKHLTSAKIRKTTRSSKTEDCNKLIDIVQWRLRMEVLDESKLMSSVSPLNNITHRSR